MRIGIDLDNTIVGYDHVFAAAAVAQGLLPEGIAASKADVRRLLRQRPDGEQDWMGLQGRVYGAMMPEARMIEGVAPFLEACRARSVPVAIVSHKTRFGHYDPDRVDLRQAARAWLDANGLFNRYGLSADAVFFEDTREAKVARVATLGFTHFIDDLEEVFAEPAFPREVAATLFHPGDGPLPQGRFRAFRSWAEIHHDILG